jgi:N-acetylglucosamine-6-phosphate deacetylase
MLLHDQLGASWVDIAWLTAANPATMLGIAHRTGSLEVGKHADIIALDDAGQVRLALIRGRRAYRPDEEVHAT